MKFYDREKEIKTLFSVSSHLLHASKLHKYTGKYGYLCKK